MFEGGDKDEKKDPDEDEMLKNLEAEMNKLNE